MKEGLLTKKMCNEEKTATNNSSLHQNLQCVDSRKSQKSILKNNSIDASAIRFAKLEV